MILGPRKYIGLGVEAAELHVAAAAAALADESLGGGVERRELEAVVFGPEVPHHLLGRHEGPAR